MSDIEKYSKLVNSVTDPGKNFKGYTLDELRYQRALVALQKEFCKAKVMNGINALGKHNPLSSSESKGSSRSVVGPLLGGVLKSFNYIDYIMIGFSVFNSARKFMSFFRKKKK